MLCGVPRRINNTSYIKCGHCEDDEGGCGNLILRFSTRHCAARFLRRDDVSNNTYYRCALLRQEDMFKRISPLKHSAYFAKKSPINIAVASGKRP